MSGTDSLPAEWTGRRAFYMSSGRTPEDRQRGNALCAAVNTAIENLQLPVTVDPWFDGQGPGAISTSIADSILSAPVVFADLTGDNPNVFYEAGVAHAAEVPVICFQEKGKHAPFDLADQRSIPVRFGDGALQQETTVRDAIQKALQHVMRPSGAPATAVGVVRLARQHLALVREASDLREALRARNETSQLRPEYPADSRATESSLLVALAREGRLDQAAAEALEAGQTVVDLRDGLGKVVETRCAKSQLTVRIHFVNGVTRTFEMTDETLLYLAPLDDLLEQRRPMSG